MGFTVHCPDRNLCIGNFNSHAVAEAYARFGRRFCEQEHTVMEFVPVGEVPRMDHGYIMDEMEGIPLSTEVLQDMRQMGLMS